MKEDLSPAELLQRRFDHLVLKPTKRIIWYRCPVCKNRVSYDGAGLEPCCTGPHWFDEHPMEVMVQEQ